MKEVQSCEKPFSKCRVHIWAGAHSKLPSQKRYSIPDVDHAMSVLCNVGLVSPRMNGVAFCRSSSSKSAMISSGFLSPDAGRLIGQMMRGPITMARAIGHTLALTT